MRAAPKEHLGDGVYVRADETGLILTAENGERATDTIYLEPEVWAALAAYVASLATIAERMRAAR